MFISRIPISVKSVVIILFFCHSSFSIEDQGDVIIQLFQWPYVDVGNECQQLAALKGVRAVQVTAPQEHRIIHQPLDDRKVRRPWWERYQPVSFKLGKTRGGTLAEFEAMVTKCEGYGIDVYVELVLNHLAATTSGTARGSDIAGTWYEFDSKTFQYSYHLKDDPPNPEAPPSNVVIGETKVCSEIEGQEPSQPEVPSVPVPVQEECHPKLVYSSKEVPVVKLDLKNSWVINQHKKTIKYLIDRKVKGFCIISASFSSAADLTELFNIQDLNRDNVFVYAELMNFNLPSRLSFKVAQLKTFSQPFAAQITKSLRHGANLPNSLERHDDKNDLLIVFAALDTVNSEDFPPFLEDKIVNFVTAFEHHEQLHMDTDSSGTFNVDYQSLADFEKIANRPAAYFFLLFALPSRGRPRVVSNYKIPSKNDHWAGPPTNDAVFSIRPPNSNQPGQTEWKWKSDHQDQFVRQLIKLRQEFFFENPSSSPDNNNSGKKEILMEPHEMSSSVAMYMLYNTDSEPRPIDERPDGATTCDLIIALVATHIHSDPESINANAVIKSRTYTGVFDYDYLLMSDMVRTPEPLIFRRGDPGLISDAPVDTVQIDIAVEIVPVMPDPNDDSIICHSYHKTTFKIAVKLVSESEAPRTIVMRLKPLLTSAFCGEIIEPPPPPAECAEPES